MIDLGFLGTIEFTWQFFGGFLSIVLIDLVLAGDNAVIIAMAVRNLPPDQRRKGIIVGAGAAVVLRVILTFMIAMLLNTPLIKLGGGLLIFWIAVKLFVEGCPEDECKKECKTIWQAMWTIMVADIVMSLDNMLAVGGASHGNLFLILFGLGLSIPFVVFTSSLLSKLMDRYPIIIYLGAAVLGKVSAEMIFTDPWVAGWLGLGHYTIWALEAIFAAGVIVIGKVWMKLFSGKAELACVEAGSGKITGHPER